MAILLKAKAANAVIEEEVEYEDATKDRIIYLVTKNNKDVLCE